VGSRRCDQRLQVELYHVAEDFSEAINLADKYPDKLRELQLLFYAEAAKYNVLPLDDSGTERVDPAIRPSLTRGRTEFIYTGAVRRIPEGAAPDLKNKSFRITADVVLAKGNTQGVLVTQGGLSGGYALMFENGKPVFYYNMANVAHYKIAAKDAMKPGKHTVVFDFKYDGGGIGKGGTGTISVDGMQVAQGRIERTVPLRFSIDETLTWVRTRVRREPVLRRAVQVHGADRESRHQPRRNETECCRPGQTSRHGTKGETRLMLSRPRLCRGEG